MRPIYLDKKIYGDLLSLLNNQHFIDKAGHQADLNFLSDDWWLQDTAVIERLVRRAGMWEIELIFAHYKNPLKLIKRIISRHTCPEKAKLYAKYMRRIAAKDPRGTLTVNKNDFKIPLN